MFIYPVSVSNRVKLATTYQTSIHTSYSSSSTNTQQNNSTGSQQALKITWTKEDDFKDSNRHAHSPNDDDIRELGGGPRQAVGEGSGNREHLVKGETGGAHHGAAGAEQENG